jgi:hypothetical protein
VTFQLETRIRQRLLEITKAGVGNPLLGSSFEYIVHRILRSGGNFDVRPLEHYDIEDYDYTWDGNCFGKNVIRNS